MAKDNINGSKILLVQSNPEYEAQLKEIISEVFDVICVQDKNNIISLLNDSKLKIETLIIDISLAIPILKDIRSNPEIKNFPVLVSTDIDNSELENEMLQLDVIDFLKTPFNKLRVLNRLKTTIKLAEANNAIKELEHDELTGLLTRKAFLRKAELIRKHNPDKLFSIIAFDFDNFKSSNTLYGVEKCNEFLAYTAKQLIASLPTGIAGRYGGDQFISFFSYKKDLNLDFLVRQSKRILDKAPIPHQVVKIGIYAPVELNISIVLCCDRAFLAIRDIKGKYDKNIAFFESNLQHKLLSEQRIIETMERALDENQFRVFYQPKHETLSGNIAGAEALVRWQHPEYGFMAPNQFIPLFEKNGFITKLDNYILEKVCQDICRWEKNGFPVVPVSVNISRRDLLEPGCIENLIFIIDKYKIKHCLIHMEVTESLYTENTELIISQLKMAQKKDFVIEMDDFGAGYSSLGLLSSFPLNLLKLDITFVRNIIENEVIIESVIKMAHLMGLCTIAEGVETSEQFKILKTLGCDFIQGYYFSIPLPVDEFEKYIEKSFVLAIEDIPIPRLLRNKTTEFNETLLVAANEVAEGIPGGFFSYHADGKLEIISFNRELIKMYGCKNGSEFRELVGNSFKGMVHPDDFERVQSSITMQIKENDDIDYVEYRIKAKDGTIKYIEDYGRFVKTEKYGDIFFVFINDITEEYRLKAAADAELLKKLELQRNAEKIANANAAKNIFMQNISKEIITTMKEMISKTIEIKQKRNSLSEFNSSIQKLFGLEENLLCYINNIKELSLLESSSLTIKETPTDITNAVEKIYDMVEYELLEKQIHVEYWSEIQNPYIYQDLNMTTNNVVNIVRNAIKYTPSGGTIKFAIIQRPSSSAGECYIDFLCEDTGIGISKEFLPYACNKFSREDNKINAAISSSGLGLYLAKAMLKKMKGTIKITSEEGKGTKVITSQPHMYADKSKVVKESWLRTNMNENKAES